MIQGFPVQDSVQVVINEQTAPEFYVKQPPLPVIATSMVQAEQIQALLLRSAHFIVHALSQDVRFRQEGKAITDELGSVMDALGIHYEDCGCGCKGQK